MCNLCKTNPVYEFTNKRTLCKTCFIRWFEKKVFYTIRRFNMINRGDGILCEVKDDFRNVVLRDVLKFYCSKSGNVLLSSGKDYNKFALANNLDLNSFEFIEYLRKNNLKDLKKFSPAVGKIIYPLYLFLDKEILIYAELKKLKYKKGKLREIPLIQTLNPARSFQTISQSCSPPITTLLNQKIIKDEDNLKNSWINFINELEKKHPEIKNAIMNSYLKIID